MNRKLTPRVTLSLLIATLAAGTAAAALPTASASRAAFSAPEVAVHYSDLDLTRPADAARLYTRIAYAAESVCGWDYPRPLAMRAVYLRCYRASIDDAVRRVGAQTLTDLHRSKVEHSAAG